MLSTLIKSKSRVKLLTLFLTHPEERFYYTELYKRLGIAHSALQRELKELAGAGFLNTIREANVRYYWVNKELAVYPELKGIIFKTVGLADFLRDVLGDAGDIKAAFIFGSVAKNVEDASSDIDLMVIGDVVVDRLHDAVARAERRLGREINYSVFEVEDWRKQLNVPNPFVTDVAKGPKIFLIGSEDDLRETRGETSHRAVRGVARRARATAQGR